MRPDGHVCAFRCDCHVLATASPSLSLALAIVRAAAPSAKIEQSQLRPKQLTMLLMFACRTNMRLFLEETNQSRRQGLY
jgi:hypothetical protein